MKVRADNNKPAFGGGILSLLFAHFCVLLFMREHDYIVFCRLKSTLLVMLKKIDTDGNGEITKDNQVAINLIHPRP